MIIFTDKQHFIFGESFYENGGQFGSLHETYLNLIVVYKGIVNVVADELNYEIKENEASLIYSENMITLVFPRSKSSHIVWCETGELLASQAMLKQIKSPPYTLPCSDRLNTLLKMGVNLEHGESYNYELLIQSVGTAVFHEYFYQSNLLGKDSPLPTRVLYVKKYIDENYVKYIDLDEVAKNAGISKQHLSILYKKHLRCTPTQYLWKVRIENGAHLLTKSNLRVSEISDRCGFKNPYHFLRYIIIFYNHSPKELRQRNWYREPSTIKDNVSIKNLGPYRR